MKTLHRKLQRMAEKAIREYGMIRPGDRLLIGVSGGPDSLALLNLFAGPSFIPDIPFEMTAVHVDLGFKETEPLIRDQLKKHFEELGVRYRIIETDISKHMLDPNAKKNPCFICSMYRRRRIYEAADELQCNKILYGHHKDDIIETLLINIFYGRQINAMNPVQDVFKGSIHIIRPLMYVDERMLKAYAKKAGLPELPRFCPMDGNSRRDKIKTIIKDLQADEKRQNIRENIFKAHKNVHMGFGPGECGLTGNCEKNIT